MTGANAHALTKLRLEPLLDGAVWRCSLDAPKGNVLDTKLVGDLNHTLERAQREDALKALLVTAEGPHFSFGASVEEHLPATVGGMLRGFHALLARVVESDLPVVVAVRGMCLGGGLELAAACHRVCATADAKLAQPEVRLGVIAPAASVLLPLRIGQGAADDLLLSGRSITGTDAHRLGLVDELAADPEAAARAWLAEHIVPHSASTLRHATRAARWRFAREFRAGIAALEDLYLRELMRTDDALEGLHAFMEKRAPAWRNR